jgi:nucleoid DNA-binding protein
MPRCILHIGMPQTGAASIQASLDGLSDDRFLYGRLDSPNHGLALFSLFAPRPQDHPVHESEGRDAATVSAYAGRMRAALEQSLEEAGQRALLLSGEDIGTIPAEGLVKLRDYLRSRCEEVLVAGYVRAPGALIASRFQQRVKAGVAVRLDLDREYRGYQERLARFDEVFGRGHVRLWKFDPAAFPGGCATQDFCARLGISLPPGRIVRLDESLSRQAVALLYTYRKFRRKCDFSAITAAEGETLGALLAAAGNDPFRFSADVIQPVLARNRADIQWMEERLGQPLEEGPGKHVAGDVRKESDLLTPDPQAVARLIALLGPDAPSGITGATPEEVARLVHALRQKHAPQDAVLEIGGKKATRKRPAAPARKKRRAMDAAELIEAIRHKSPAALRDVPNDKAELLVRTVFRHINETLAATEEGSVSYSDLGRFAVKKSKKPHKGKKGLRARIRFRREEPRAGRAKDAEH